MTGFAGPACLAVVTGDFVSNASQALGLAAVAFDFGQCAKVAARPELSTLGLCVFLLMIPVFVVGIIFGNVHFDLGIRWNVSLELSRAYLFIPKYRKY